MFGKNNTSLPPIENTGGIPAGSKFNLISFVIALAVVSVGLAGYAWNEQRAIMRYQGFVEKVGKYTQMDPAAYEPVHEGKPVFFSAAIGPGEELKDEELGFSAGKVAALKREISMFQWVEKEVKDQDTGAVTYDYVREMSETYFDSATFAVLDVDFRNPEPLVNDKLIEAKTPMFGAYNVPIAALEKMMTPVPMPADAASRFPAAWQSRITVQANKMLIRPTGPEVRRNLELGDIEVQYKVLPVGTRVLVAGIARGTMIDPVDHIEATDIQTLDEFLQKPARGFEQDIWVTRGGAAVVVAMGFILLFGALRPLLGGMGATVGAVLSLVLACAQISKHYWSALLDVVHILNIVSAISGGVLVASMLIFGLRAARRRMAARKAPVPQAAPPPPPPPPSFNLDIPPAAPTQPPSNPV